jgi:hypothetical protein
MIKFSFKLATFLFLLLSSVAQAGLITSENNHVSIDGLDWIWASSVNEQGFVGMPLRPGEVNIISGPSDGWRYAEEDELVNLRNAILLDSDFYLGLFTNDDGTYKHALSDWNSHLTNLTLFGGFGSISDLDNFKAGQINSRISANPDAEWQYETFYVRGTTQVPEPSTIMIFAIALIALTMRKRAIN